MDRPAGGRHIKDQSVNWLDMAMREIGAFEAKTRLSELLAAVEAGESVTITRRGKAVARLVPLAPDAATRAEAAARIRALRRRVGAGMTTEEILAARDAGRR